MSGPSAKVLVSQVGQLVVERFGRLSWLGIAGESVRRN